MIFLFKYSNNPVYQKIYQHMEHRKSFVSTMEEGVRRAQEGNFAFIGEAVSLDLAVARYCTVTRSPDVIGMRSYALAAPQGELVPQHLYLSNSKEVGQWSRSVLFHSSNFHIWLLKWHKNGAFVVDEMISRVTEYHSRFPPGKELVHRHPEAQRVWRTEISTWQMVGEQLFAHWADSALSVSTATWPAGTLPLPGCGIKRRTPFGLDWTSVEGSQSNQGWKGRKLWFM